MNNWQFNPQLGNNPLTALKCFGEGLSYLKKPELRKYLLIPILINFALYSVALGLGYLYIDELIARFIPDWLSWLSWVLIPLFLMSFFVIVFFSFTLIANLIAAPFYDKLAQKTLELVSGETAEIIEQPTLQVIFSAIKRLIYFAIRALPLLILFIIPVINIIAPLIWLIFGAWAIILEYLAYPLENEGILFEQQREMTKTIRFGSLSFGGLIMLGLTIPILNIIVPPTAVIASTLYFYQIRIKKETEEQDINTNQTTNHS